MDVEPWYSVRCLFRHDGGGYEERITVWEADGFEQAVSLAEADAHEYADVLDAEYLGFAQAFHLATSELTTGTEVFSLVRESELPPTDYLNAFFDTGMERQQRM